jgi:diguanylate cyclase (GGDEF)-like protein
MSLPVRAGTPASPVAAGQPESSLRSEPTGIGVALPRTRANGAHPPSAEERERHFLRRAQQVLGGALLVLAVTVLVALSRTPTDLVTGIQVLAVLVLATALGFVYRVERRLSRTRENRDAGMTRMVQGMSRSGSPEAIVESIVEELRRTADADHIVVARLRPVHRVVETMLVSSRGVVPPSRSIMPAGVLDPNGPAEPSRRLRRPGSGPRRTAQGVADDLASKLGSVYALSNTLAAPLIAGSDIVGALILSRRGDRKWSDVDRQLLEFSASELSAALARAFAFEEAEIRANIDALTGLPNRRYLEDLLATVGPRRRSIDRIGALMIDLDHFKRLNDRYGHATGDLVLRAVAQRIFEAVRADDTPARYGGEEFAVVLRRASPEQALEVAERIRTQIGALDARDLGIDERITVSVGVAVADGRDDDVKDLLADADRALYRAKREGRNRVVLAR